MVYVLVSGILVWLVRLSAGVREKLYFGFCATSAGTGLLRVLFGDTSLHAGAFIRAVMLACAIVTCTMIWRSHRGNVKRVTEFQVRTSVNGFPCIVITVGAPGA